MSRAPGDLVPTAGQTVGPFFHDALPYPGDSELVPPGRADAVRFHGVVVDGAGDPVPDALIEIWQADAEGRIVQQPGSLRRDGFTFTGWGRSATDAAGHYSFSTVRPGPADPGAAPFVAVTVFARGLLDRLFTRAYLPGDLDVLAADAAAGRARPGAPEHPVGRRGRGRSALRHPPPGGGRDRLPPASATLRPMVDLFWPGSDRAGDVFTNDALIEAMVAVEEAWLVGLVDAGIAPRTIVVPDLLALVQTRHHEWLENESELGGNPAMALVALLRDGLRDAAPDAATWLHRGLTSQDVIDSALMICARDAVERLRQALRDQLGLLSRLIEEHRSTPMVARTLTQHAVPTTFGLKAAGWLTGVLDAYDDVAALVLPVQVGGAAGTMAGVVELADHLPDPVGVAHQLSVGLAGRLGLTPSTPWHTSRASVTRLGDASVRCTDAWGRIAGDVLVLSRPEIGEVSEGTGGGSSTMPHKSNPVLATLVRRTALTTPQLAATLHQAAAESTDERSPGPWHAEWATLRTLLRHAVIAADQVTELLEGLRVHADRMGRTLAAAHEDVRAEQRSMAALTGRPPREDYLGATAALIEAPLARALAVLAEPAPTARPEETP